MGSEPVELDPRTATEKQLDDIRQEYAGEVGSIVAKLCNQAKRTDGTAIIERIADDIEQILVVGYELGRRDGIKEKQRDTAT